MGKIHTPNFRSEPELVLPEDIEMGIPSRWDTLKEVASSLWLIPLMLLLPCVFTVLLPAEVRTFELYSIILFAFVVGFALATVLAYFARPKERRGGQPLEDYIEQINAAREPFCID